MEREARLLDDLACAFPIEPRPSQYLLPGVDQTLGDIPGEIVDRLVARPWTEIGAGDWAMTGAPVPVIRGYLEPAAFRYLLPSLLAAAIRAREEVRPALEALLPHNHDHMPRGPEWAAYANGFDLAQRRVIADVLRMIDEETEAFLDQPLLDPAKAIWLSV